MEKIIKNPSLESKDDMLEFGEIFRSGRYIITAFASDKDKLPDSVVDEYLRVDTFQRILDDPNAYFNCYGIQYTLENDNKVGIPIGIFGVSDLKEVRFPLLVNLFWQTFLMIDKDRFNLLAGFTNPEERDHYFQQLIQLRKTFITRVFDYFRTAGSIGYSAMAWDIRGKKSNTRNIAEGVGFKRIENNGFELYSSLDTPNEKWDYLKNCIIRWGITVDKNKRAELPLRSNVGFFIKSLVGYYSTVKQ